jgi:hypothetical protein
MQAASQWIIVDIIGQPLCISMTSYCIFSVTAPAGALQFPVVAASSLLNGTEDVRRMDTEKNRRIWRKERGSFIDEN